MPHVPIRRGYRATVVGILLAAACAGGGDSPGADMGVQVRDSAGVRIVSNTRPSVPASTWRISLAPTLSIGSADGQEPYQLYRVADALQLPDGRIVVSNEGTGEVRVFGADGTFVTRFGRRGDGPGEFGEFTSMSIERSGADTLIVTDSRGKRAHYFSLDGEYGRTERFSTLTSTASYLGRADSGDWFVSEFESSAMSVTTTSGDGSRTSVSYSFVPAAGGDPRSLLTVEGPPGYVVRLGNRRSIGTVPFTTYPSASSVSDQLLVAEGVSPEVRRFDSGGRLLEILRWSPERVGTDEIWEEYRSRLLEREGDPAFRRERQRVLDGLSIPDHLPSVVELRVSADGSIWARRYSAPGDTLAIWDVLASDGRWVTSIEIPFRLQVYEIGPDYLLGKRTDSLGVETIVSHALERG